ncbi:MAG: hypothetical protein AAFQ87_06665 [Bacteroidota bacterium]
MTKIIRKNLSKKDIQAILGQAKPYRRFNAQKHVGVLTLSISPLEIQKSLRDEWE